MATNTAFRAIVASALAFGAAAGIATTELSPTASHVAFGATTSPSTTVADAATGTCAGGRAGRTPHPTPRALATPTASTYSYDWPLKPFDRQHPVRAYLDDPRIGRVEHVFHFGIDIAGRDGAPVYSVAAGRAVPGYEKVAVVGDGVVFAYWHIVPVVNRGAYVARHQLLGYIGKTWGHVHFAEIRHGHFLNPLRPGALGPYADRTAPTLAAAGADSGTPHVLAGRVDLVADAFDTPPVRVGGRWHDEPVTPALVRWRLVGVTAWRTAADFRRELLAPASFDRVYSSVTSQNHIGDPGLFCFNLVRRFDTTRLENGTYTLQVELRDTGNNRTIAGTTLTVDNR